MCLLCLTPEKEIKQGRKVSISFKTAHLIKNDWYQDLRQYHPKKKCVKVRNYEKIEGYFLEL